MSRWVALGAGIAIVVGSFLPWASITAPFVGTVTGAGTDGSDGWITAAAGALLALYGAVTLRRRLPTALAVLAMVGGVAVAGVAVWKIVDLRLRVADLRAELADSPDGDEFGFGAAMADAVHVRVGAGLWLLVAAGLGAGAYIGYTLLRCR